MRVLVTQIISKQNNTLKVESLHVAKPYATATQDQINTINTPIKMS